MKKVLAMILAVVMLLSMAACGSGDVRGVQSNNQSSTEPTDKEFSVGAVSGLTYENEFIGIGCKLDGEWTFSSDEEIREMNNVTAEMAGEEYRDMIKDASVIYDMHATHSNGLDNIIVNLEKVNPLQLIGLDLADNYEALLPTMRDAFENIGYTDIEFNISTVTIDGKEFTALYVNAVIAGYEVYQANIAIKCNGYLASVSVTTYGQEALNQVLKSFYLV